MMCHSYDMIGKRGWILDLDPCLHVFRGNCMDENFNRQSALLDPFKNNPIIVGEMVVFDSRVPGSL
jgi:hypothetical protein